MTFEEWESGVPLEMKDDPLWHIEAYRLSLFLSDLAWHDATKLSRDARTVGVCDQLYRAVGKISSNVSEGYSRGTAMARIQYYEYALGSTRESRDWYFKGRFVLSDSVTSHRIELTTSIMRLLLTTIRNERQNNRRISSRKDG